MEYTGLGKGNRCKISVPLSRQFYRTAVCRAAYRHRLSTGLFRAQSETEQGRRCRTCSGYLLFQLNSFLIRNRFKSIGEFRLISGYQGKEFSYTYIFYRNFDSFFRLRIIYHAMEESAFFDNVLIYPLVLYRNAAEVYLSSILIGIRQRHAVFCSGSCRHGRKWSSVFSYSF